MQFTYVGYTRDKQLIKGTISAVDEATAQDMLSNIGYKLVSLKVITPFLPDLSNFFQGNVKSSEMILFSKQLALLLESGLGIVQSLELLQAQVNDAVLRKSLIQVITDLRSGSALSVALSKHPHVFSRIYQKMVAVGEQTGGLEGVLRSLAIYAERQNATISKLKTALTYPAIVVCVGILVGILMTTVVLPPIVNMFTQLGGELPITTKLLLAVVGFMNSYGLYVSIALLALVLLAYLYSKSVSGRYYRDLLMLKLPVVGRLYLLTELARCSRNMSLLFRAGLPLPEIMTLTAQSSGNVVVTLALNAVEKDMLKGEGLSAPMRKRKVFLPLMVEMVKVGEATGTLDNTLITVAENYEMEADGRTQTLVSMIEPIMTIIIGIAVGFLALSIFMPLYSSLNLIGGR